MKVLNNFLKSVLSGICIGLAGAVYLTLDNKIVGAALFTIALFAIVTNNFNLYTGKVGYIPDNPPKYAGFVAFIWLGNLVGTVISGLLINATRISSISEKAAYLCDIKLNDSLISVFILSVFCGILMYIAVDGFKNNEHIVGKYVGLFLCIIVFILAGFEHCIANMLYFTLAKVWSGRTIIYLLVMSLGNGVGGMLIPLVKKTEPKSQAAAAEYRKTTGVK